jgi:hypothetical protein
LRAPFESAAPVTRAARARIFLPRNVRACRSDPNRRGQHGKRKERGEPDAGARHDGGGTAASGPKRSKGSKGATSNAHKISARSSAGYATTTAKKSLSRSSASVTAARKQDSTRGGDKTAPRTLGAPNAKHAVTGEKPFKCSQCSYCTGQKGHLARHEKVHAKSSEVGRKVGHPRPTDDADADPTLADVTLAVAPHTMMESDDVGGQEENPKDPDEIVWM